MTMTKPRKIALGFAAGILALCGLGAALSGGDKTPTPASADVPAATTEVQPETAPPAAAPAAPALTTAQKNAVRSATNYLRTSAFSRPGLIKQLQFEGYSTEDATIAVDSITVDWMEQAAKKARLYLNTAGFSRISLIKQLEFEGFTPEQAAHGADAVGL